MVIEVDLFAAGIAAIPAAVHLDRFRILAGCAVVAGQGQDSPRLDRGQGFPVRRLMAVVAEQDDIGGIICSAGAFRDDVMIFEATMIVLTRHRLFAAQAARQPVT